MLALPAVTNAEELINVDSIGDEADALVGVAGCLTVAGKCTLRAAIEESNGSLGEVDEILFDEGVFDGQASGTIVLGGSLPAVVDPVRINGLRCPTEAGVAGPCVGVEGPAAGPALTIDGVEGVEIEGLAVTGAQTGIVVDGSAFSRIRANWFGVGLDGTGDGNATGVFVGPGSDVVRIGGEGADAGNVFADNTGEGLHVHGAAEVRVLGNYFGVEGDGTTEAANGKDIEVTSVPTGGPEAIGTAIGTRVSASAAATPECDGGCNVISGAAASGIDLEGDGGTESAAVETTIAGNYVGLNALGTAAVPNETAGILVGRAERTVIGGPKAADANRINGGSVGVSAGPGASDLVVRGNLLGADVAGTESLAPPEDGIVVDSEGLSSAAVEAVIADNTIRMDGGVAIVQHGFGARISGNEISDAGTGIKTDGFTLEHGNLIEGNSLTGLGASGILVENDFNEVLGNEIFGTGAAGIAILGALPFGVSENLIGGDGAAEENIISGSGGAAIEISNVEATRNEVARNRGSLNGGLFIELSPADPESEPNGPNNGIEPPTLTILTQASAGGSAEPGAKVRVFRKRTAEAGELESFLGEATADAGGNWQVPYSGTIPAGTVVAATQTSEGGTSELVVATTPGSSGQTGGGGGSGSGGGSTTTGNGAGNPASDTPPGTKILKAPKKKSKSSTARFEFSSDELGSTFQCKLDGKPFRACSSPKKYQGLKPGKHVFKVRAIDPAGHADSSPAKKEFTVIAGSGR